MTKRLLLALCIGGMWLISASACVYFGAAERDRVPVMADLAGPQPLDLDTVAELLTTRANELRAAHNVGPVRPSNVLEETARNFAAYMARTDRYGHTADGNEPAERARRQGYDLCMLAENIAYTYREDGYTEEQLAAQVAQGWADSPTHRRNILDAAATEVGTAVAHSERSGHYYSVQLFGRPQSDAISFSVANETGREIVYRLNDRELALDPRQIRTHEVCEPPELALDGRATLRPGSGERLTIVQRPDGPRIERRGD